MQSVTFTGAKTVYLPMEFVRDPINGGTVCPGVNLFPGTFSIDDNAWAALLGSSLGQQYIAGGLLSIAAPAVEGVPNTDASLDPSNLPPAGPGE